MWISFQLPESLARQIFFSEFRRGTLIVTLTLTSNGNYKPYYLLPKIILCTDSKVNLQYSLMKTILNYVLPSQRTAGRISICILLLQITDIRFGQAFLCKLYFFEMPVNKKNQHLLLIRELRCSPLGVIGRLRHTQT